MAEESSLSEIEEEESESEYSSEEEPTKLKETV